MTRWSCFNENYLKATKKWCAYFTSHHQIIHNQFVSIILESTDGVKEKIVLGMEIK